MAKMKKKLRAWIGPGLFILLLDRAVKTVYLLAEGDPYTNTGMAFGWFEGNSALILIASAALLGLSVFLLRDTKPRGAARFSLSLMAGGAVGNMIDRLIYGSVIDMIPFFGWFVFNPADAGIVGGVILCLWSLLFRPYDWSR